jgi:hypothetical protein
LKTRWVNNLKSDTLMMVFSLPEEERVKWQKVGMGAKDIA